MAKQARLIDVPHYKYWQALYMAFYSSRLYVDVAKRWRGFGCGYFLLMLSILVLPMAIKIMLDFNHYFDEQVILPFKMTPEIYIQNGQCSFDKTMPYFIRNPQGDIVAIIDTTGKITTIDNTYPKLTILITEHQLVYRAPKFHLFFLDSPIAFDNQIQVSPFEPDANEVFEGDDWIKYSHIMVFKWFTLFIIFPVITMFLFGLSFSFMLAFALLGQVFAHVILRFDLRFQTTCRLLAVASTPLFSVVLNLLSMNFLVKGQGLFFIALLAVYFSYAVLRVKHESKKMVLL
jgi:hypothetical protein